MSLILGDCLTELPKLAAESVDLLVTDPPYGLLFMGKDWDRAVPSVEVWKECLRVLKPGAFAFIMSSPRLDVLSQMAVRLGEAGFNVGFTPIYWTFASGFPKSLNIRVALHHRLAAPSQSLLSGVWEKILHQTRGLGESDDGRVVSTMLADLERGAQCKVYALTRGETEGVQIPQGECESIMEGWGHLPKETRQLCQCSVCKMPIGLFLNGKERRVCYGTQAGDGSVTWEAVSKGGVRSSYQSQPIGQSLGELDIICEQCVSQKVRGTIRAKGLEGAFGGWQPKPAVEIIIVAQKPNSEPTYLDQSLTNQKGVTWLDEARIPFQSTDDFEMALGAHREADVFFKQDGRLNPKASGGDASDSKGRFPANLLVSDDVLNDGIERPGSGNKVETNRAKIGDDFLEGIGGFTDRDLYGTVDSFSRYFSLDQLAAKLPWLYFDDMSFAYSKANTTSSQLTAAFARIQSKQANHSSVYLVERFVGLPSVVSLGSALAHNTLSRIRDLEFPELAHRFDILLAGSSSDSSSHKSHSDPPSSGAGYARNLRALVGFLDGYRDDSRLYGGLAQMAEGLSPECVLLLACALEHSHWSLRTDGREPTPENTSRHIPSAEALLPAVQLLSRYLDEATTQYNLFAEKVKELPEAVRKTFPFLIEPKAGKEERNEGLEGMEEKKPFGTFADGSKMGWADETNPNGKNGDNKRANHHPTVKPLALMSYLITLGSRRGDVVLDPFAGSGTTIMAAKMLGRKGIGIEINEEYAKIAKARLDSISSLESFIQPTERGTPS